MPRDIPIGNGQMLVNFDAHYRIRDVYFPHVGQENHAGGEPCRFGVWGAVPQSTTRLSTDRRKRRLFWTDEGWDLQLGYREDTLVTDVRLRHETLAVTMHCRDVVDFHRPLMVRRIELHNDCDEPRRLHLFHHQDVNMFGTKLGDTVFFDPRLRALVHYRGKRYLMASWYADGEMRLDQFATGTAGFGGAEGTWRDAEDGELGGNPIAQGAVDSTMMLQVFVEPRGSRVAYLLIGAGYTHEDLHGLLRFIHRETPQGAIDRTAAYWRLWLSRSRADDIAHPALGLSERACELYRRSLLIVRSQIDESGAVIAANDSDILAFARDTYSYVWPRDGALTTDAMDAAGFPDIARQFFQLCARILDPQGYLQHKYNPDGSVASSWHPWASLGEPQLPIQEDETALVLWALWRHFERSRDVEFVRPLWVRLVRPAADFMTRFIDPDTDLPLPCYDLWEERWGVHAFTVAAVHGGLIAAARFANAFGDSRLAGLYDDTAQRIARAFCRHFWSARHRRFLRRIVPIDHARTARFMAEVLAGRSPKPTLDEQGRLHRWHQPKVIRPAGAQFHSDGPLEFEDDAEIDSSLVGIHLFGMLPSEDLRVEQTMQQVERRLAVPGPAHGFARYESDAYHRHSDVPPRVPGNPWIISTLWIAQWRIARAIDRDALAEALPMIDWAAERALASGVLPEQVDARDGTPLSVSPLTWSHATVVATINDYVARFDAMTTCKHCGQPWRGGGPRRTPASRGPASPAAPVRSPLDPDPGAAG